ncbi:MAG: hypothetical protein HOK54_06485 [Alphaproteobacteria bacterium]|nr:hypothetical protein [Alphaproteobacteria bacterium]
MTGDHKILLLARLLTVMAVTLSLALLIPVTQGHAAKTDNASHHGQHDHGGNSTGHGSNENIDTAPVCCHGAAAACSGIAFLRIDGFVLPAPRASRAAPRYQTLHEDRHTIPALRPPRLPA